ncbi:hypothetical protein [Sulfuricurvum sp.]|uniref:hypothetical protein n=1 Tax=Sulfuricurvum sp. TaxID=2025608 RepID=UPI00263457D2|nr:hypothetical protein [Sulfuricurvum sp.]MDD3595774.1 hypothetical protein [Sulfuricurvum sp.]
MTSMNIIMTILISGTTIGVLWLMLNTFAKFRRPKTLSNQELIALIDERIAFHSRGDEMERIIFGGQESVWNAPHYAKLKGEVSEHLREAELDSVIVLIEHQRLKTLQIEELKLKLQLMEKQGGENEHL